MRKQPKGLVAAGPGAYFGFPAVSHPQSGTFAAAVYDTPLRAAADANRAVAFLDLRTNATVYSTAGVVACTRDVAAALPAPVVSMTWR